MSAPKIGLDIGSKSIRPVGPERRRPAPVSVVIPCFEAAATLERALDSVRAQTWPPAEAILVDDGSADETPALFSRLLEGDRAETDRGGEATPPYLRTIRLDRNRGPGAARNAGWAAATQPLIAFLDADDAWHSRKIEIQADFMLARPGVALSGHASGFGPGFGSGPVRFDGFRFRVGNRGRGGGIAEVVPGRAGARRSRAGRSRAGEIAEEGPEILRRDRRIAPARLLARNDLPTRSVMVRREIPFRFAEDKRRSEDYLLWLEIALSGRPIRRLSARLARSFKPDVGAGGLTADPARMAAAERDVYRRLRKSGVLGTLPAISALGFSWLRYGLRRVRLGVRRRAFRG